MPEKKDKITTIDDYIAQASPAVQPILAEIRALIHETAPLSEERISYQMPAFFLNGVLVWFGAFKHHIGFYPMGSVIEAFKSEVFAYQSAKSSLNFPLDQPMPYDLIRKIVRFRVAENLKKG